MRRNLGEPSQTCLPLCSDRPNPNDHAESRTSHQAKQADWKCCILAGTLCWFPPPMRCLCSILIQVITTLMIYFIHLLTNYCSVDIIIPLQKFTLISIHIQATPVIQYMTEL